MSWQHPPEHSDQTRLTKKETRWWNKKGTNRRPSGRTSGEGSPSGSTLRWRGTFPEWLRCSGAGRMYSKKCNNRTKKTKSWIKCIRHPCTDKVCTSTIWWDLTKSSSMWHHTEVLDNQINSWQSNKNVCRNLHLVFVCRYLILTLTIVEHYILHSPNYKTWKIRFSKLIFFFNTFTILT